MADKMIEKTIEPKRKPGRHFFANPGPTTIPESVLRAMDRGTIDFVEAEFLDIYDRARAGLKRLLFTEHEVFFYAATGHGAWEATMVNLFSPGERILVIGGGYFSSAWAALSQKFGLEAELFDVDWREGADLAALREKIAADSGHSIKALCVVHN